MELVWLAHCGMLKSGLMSRESDLGGSYLMRERKTWLIFLMRRGWLYVQGLLRFGPVRTQRGGKSVRMALDAFEHYYGRLPDTDERLRLVQKLSWFDQHQKRIPTQEEVAQIVQQLELR
jgi:hypothetical protein